MKYYTKMRLILSILFATLYLAFNIGLTLQVHQCAEVNKGISKEVTHHSASSKDCHKGNSHSCCEASEVKSCCSNEMNEDDCCYNENITFQINQEQVVSKAFLFFPIIETVFSEQFAYELSLNSVSHEQFIIKNPPPLIEQKPILYCSLILYA